MARKRNGPHAIARQFTRVTGETISADLAYCIIDQED